MATDLRRDFVADLEIRADGDGRTVHGIVVPFGQSAMVSDGGPSYEERFQRGAFTKTLQERKAPVYLLSQHNPTAPLGRATNLREDAAGLYGEFRVSNTAAGNDHLELVRDGVLGSFSVGFRPIGHKREGNVTIRTEVALREVSLVTFPAYDGALVGGVRSEALIDLPVDPFADVEASRAWLDQVLENADDGDEDPLISFARRLDAAIKAKTGTPEGAASDGPREAHPGRLTVARNNLRAALIERGIKP